MKKTALLAISTAALGIVAVPTAAHAATVNVAKGDTLWSIAQQHNTSIKTLENLNNNVNPYKLQIGMALQVSKNQSQNNNVKSIIVKSGDTLWGISKKYNTTVNNLMKINHLTNDTIYIGQVLQLEQSVVNNAQNAVKDTKQVVVVRQQNNYSVNHNNHDNGYQNNNSTPTITSRTVAAKKINEPAYNNSETTVTTQNNNSTSFTGSEAAAANAIAEAESGGSWTAQNGRYYGKYQLDISYLHGDLSPANQERVFQQYCNQRYGSVQNALAFREAHGWY